MGLYPYLFLIGISIYSVICIEIRCPTDWLPRAGSSKCYFVSSKSQQTTWQDAREFCQFRNGDLVVVKDVAEKNWVLHTAGEAINDSMFWVGLWDPKQTNTFIWVDNSTFTPSITPWSVGYSGNCARLNQDGKLYKALCNIQYPFVCERQIDTPILCDIDLGWEHIGKACFKYVEEEVEWYDAYEDCWYDGADLIIVDSLIKRQYMEDKAKQYKKKIWFGFTNMFDKEYEWVWDKNGDVDNWQQGEPRNFTNPANFTNLCGLLPYSGFQKWITDDCMTENSYVCEHAEGKCPTGWETYRHSCYQMNFALQYSRPWEEAKETCENQGAKLVVIDDAQEQYFLTSTLYDYTNQDLYVRDVWIGLSDVGYLALRYTWVDGKTPADKKYFNWQNNNNMTGFTNSTNCVKIVAGGWSTKWIREPCDSLLSFICEAPLGTAIKPVAPTHAPLYCNSSAGWQQFGDYCYMFVRKSLTWPAAQKNCKDFSSNLTSVTTRAENTWITERMATFGHWIGLNSKSSDNVWVWDDGTEVTFLNWAPGEPNGGGNLNKPESCVEMQFSYYSSSKGKWNDHFCDVKKYSVCKRKADLDPNQVFTLAPTTPWSTKCGAYWLEDPYSHNCYRYDLERLTWHDARTHCQLYNGDLVSILTLAEQRFVNDIAKRATVEDPNIVEFWIGFTDRDEEGKWKWSDSRPSSFFNWNPGEPNNADKEDCGTTFASNGRWNDLTCEKRLPYICKKSLGATTIIVPVTYPPTKPGQRYLCKSGWIEYRNECYYFSKDKKTWDAARTECKVSGYGGDLATIKAAYEQSFIVGRLSTYAVNDRLWIGFNDKDVEFEFRWVDGSKVTYTNWMKNEPNHYAGNKEDCVNVYKEVTKPGGWNDDLCTNQWFYICRTLKQLYVSPTVPPTVQGCRAGFEAYENGCYKFDTTARTWDRSSTVCKQANGELIDILDIYEQSYITGRLATRTGDFWIGLSANSQGTFQWTSGRPVRFSNWGNKQPDTSVKCVSASTGTNSPGFWKTQSCTSLLSSICKAPKDGFTFPTIPTTTPTPLKCPTGWRERGNFCYMEKYTTNKLLRKSFSEARQNCQLFGADLVSIHSQDEDTFVRNYVITGTYWIGLRSQNGTGHYWVDGTGAQYFNWLPGEPNNHNGMELCVELNANARGWQDTACEAVRDYVCKASKDVLAHSSLRPLLTTTISISTTPAVVCGGDPDWKLFQGDCYFFTRVYAERETWSNARQKCRDKGAELLSIKSPEEQSYILSQVGKLTFSSMWIGMHALHEHDIYEWSDNTPVGFTNWAKGEPNNYGGAEACGAMYTNSGFWNDDNCAVVQGYICRKANNTASFTLPPPTIRTGNCPWNWYQFEGKCYKLFDKFSSWSAARNECRKLGGSRPDLLSIHSSLEQTFVITLLQGIDYNVWFGLIDLLKNRVWYWADNTIFDYSNWNAGEPGYYWNSKGDCASMLPLKSAAGKWSTENCDKPNGYICQRTVDDSIITPPPPKPCQRYQNEGFSQFGKNCYHLLTEGHSWSESKDLCQTKAGGSAVLASVMNIFEESYIRTFFSTELTDFIWIGLSDKITSNIYTWTNDQPVTYTNWAKNEPSKGEGEGCVAIMANGQWNDTKCNQQFRGLCKIEFEKFTTHVPRVEGTCPNITAEWIPSHGKYCYLYRQRVMKTYSDASMECQRLRGTLATFDEWLEYNFVFENLARSQSNIWIGLYKTLDGEFKWIDDSPLSFTNWDSGEPSNGVNENCVDVSLNNKWSDTSCGQSKEFICKASKVLSTTTTPLVKTTTNSASRDSTPSSTTFGPPNPESTASKETPKAEESKGGKQRDKLDTGSTIAIIEAVACILIVLVVIIFIIRRQRRNAPPKLGDAAHSFDNALYNADSDTVNIDSYDKKAAINYNY